ncbi:unnamed protein product [Rotaria sp. Silwood2]|nr:unnamed protein product [Rotaria sp. Silwood2]CAF2646552.1 unnamed protein product [Rotaria sp. Silwood2]CAF2865527.1 unnamed protein product [Rotaria sp. Silwood2]CAF2957610.1 unnamed protein product [Rotaria sp. Silwood2]CAF3862581.1 unnamed protein product [Rotaria sp. Silwood2]
MSSLIHAEKWKFALIHSNPKEADKFRSIVDSKVYQFQNAPSFMTSLCEMVDARKSLILVAPDHLIRSLPSDIETRVHKLYIYNEDGENKYQSLNDIYLDLSNLILAQSIERTIFFRRSKQNGAARLHAQESMAQTKKLIDQLSDLCHDIDENILLGKEAET